MVAGGVYGAINNIAQNSYGGASSVTDGMADAYMPQATYAAPVQNGATGSWDAPPTHTMPNGAVMLGIEHPQLPMSPLMDGGPAMEYQAPQAAQPQARPQQARPQQPRPKPAQVQSMGADQGMVRMGQHTGIDDATRARAYAALGLIQ
jgi:hypothetical protein